MVLRCSLLGHDFGESDVEREREERGSEVVVTVREYEECTRCGDVRVVSESTEVTSLTHDEAASIPDDESVPPAELDDADLDVPPEIDEIGDDAEILEDDVDDAGDVPDPVEVEASDDGAHAITDRPEPSTGDASADSIEEVEDPTKDDAPMTDDGEILEDGRVDDDRAPGEWPDTDDVGPPVGMENEPASWPDAGPSDGSEATDDHATVEDDVEPVDDAVFVDANDQSAPEPPVTDSGTGIASAQSAPTPGKSTPTDPVATEYFCPNCSFVAPGTRGSLRPGDICPECRRGYLGERELE